MQLPDNIFHRVLMPVTGVSGRRCHYEASETDRIAMNAMKTTAEEFFVLQLMEHWRLI